MSDSNKSEENLLRSIDSAQVGPEAKEYNLLRADEEYRNGNSDLSIYYQVKAQFHSTDTRYMTEWEDVENQIPNTDAILCQYSAAEQAECRNKKLLQNVLSYLQQKEREEKSDKKTGSQIIENLDFLEDIVEPAQGLTCISDICNQLPSEWTVVQLCKSFNAATTYSAFGEIFSAEGAIYLAMLNHCRSSELGPTCLRFNSDELADVFKQYGTVIERFRRIINVDPKTVKSQESKQRYWQELNAFEVFMQELIDKLRSCFAPYVFLFLGKRYDNSAVAKQTKLVYRRVDEFCQKHGWCTHQRILLSQAALQANKLNETELKHACIEIAANDTTQGQLAYELMKTCTRDWHELEGRQPLYGKRYPTILVVDERLDHLNWEQLAPMQEFTRIKSLHSLWRLYKFHKPRIQHGYYTTKVTQGMCAINPDADLPNSGRRMRSFFEYWLSQWRHLFETVPTEQMILEEAYNADCFVYAGHGSGLQYISAKTVCRARVKGVVFLFGCDSTRLHGTGLYSALYGAHNYYHGALCPTVVGTLMPALDANMDTVSVSVLSRWLEPGAPQVMPWTHIDRVAWVTKGEIKARESNVRTLDKQPDYQQGSLCGVLSLVQQGLVEPKVYNCCVYVCRGLPAWNLAVQPLPF